MRKEIRILVKIIAMSQYFASGFIMLVHLANNLIKPTVSDFIMLILRIIIRRVRKHYEIIFTTSQNLVNNFVTSTESQSRRTSMT